MEKYTLDLPTMYGDHHVLEVRRILLEIPGIQDVYASSAFRAVEVTYDPAEVISGDIHRQTRPGRLFRRYAGTGRAGRGSGAGQRR